MPMFRVSCEQCGLSATHIRGGDQGVTSVDPDECAVRCPAGWAAQATGDNAALCVGACEHLLAAVRAKCKALSEERDVTRAR